MYKIEFRKIGSLELHPDNVEIFGSPQDEPNYEEIREDIRKRGLQEPLIILSNGIILSGHIRFISVCWVMEQEGLTKDQIAEEVIAVRIHEDFESKEEELEYLMDANEKRRQLGPRRIAASLEKLERVIEASWVEKKGFKKSDALKGLADRLGTSHKLAKSYQIIFSSKVVPEEVKEKVNSKDLPTLTVLEAIKFAEESAKRENRAPSMSDVDVYIKHPKPKTSLTNTIRQVTKTATSTRASSPTTKSESKVTTIEVPSDPPKVAAPEPIKIEEKSVEIEDKPVEIEEKSVEIEDKPVEIEEKSVEIEDKPVEIEDKPVEVSTVPTSHCCLESGEQKQEDSCETCVLISKGYFDQDDEDQDQGVDFDECLDGPSPVDQVTTARRLLKEALGVLILDATSTSELLGLHTELTAYLLAMGIINPLVEFNPPTTTLNQRELCETLVVDPQDTQVSCPKCDLVDIADIRVEGELPASFQPSPKDSSIFTDEDLGSILEAEAISDPPKPEKSLGLTFESKKIPVTTPVQAYSATEGPESDLVSEVIFDFLVEIQKAGIDPSA
jgi:hypothetical protein